MEFERILVVCVGNICRSPMAAALISAKYPNKSIDSAGMAALVGENADPKAVDSMSAHGIDITTHVAKQIDEELLGSADLVLTMSTYQVKSIEAQWPHCRGRTFRIGHWIDKDILDPYGHDESAFEKARKDIVDSLDHWFKKISE